MSRPVRGRRRGRTARRSRSRRTSRGGPTGSLLGRRARSERDDDGWVGITVPVADERELRRHRAAVRSRRRRAGPAVAPRSDRRPPGGAPCLSGDGRAPKTAERLGRMLVIVPYLVQHPGSELSEVATRVRRARRSAPARPRPVVHVRPAAVRARRSHRGGRRRGRSHLDLDGRALRPSAAALPERGAGALPPRDGAARHRRRAGGAGARARRWTSCGHRSDRRRSGMPSGSRRPTRERRSRPWSRSETRLESVVAFVSTTSRTRRGSGRSRVIDPEQVFVALGHWYVAAWDVTIDAERLFRVDRIRQVELTGEGFEPRGLEGAGRSLYTPTEEDVAVRLRLRPGGPVDRRVLRDHGRARRSRRVAGHHDARAVAGVGRAGCCSVWGATRPCWSHPN